MAPFMYVRVAHICPSIDRHDRHVRCYTKLSIFLTLSVVLLYMTKMPRLTYLCMTRTSVRAARANSTQFHSQQCTRSDQRPTGSDHQSRRIRQASYPVAACPPTALHPRKVRPIPLFHQDTYGSIRIRVSRFTHIHSKVCRYHFELGFHCSMPGC